MMLGRQPKGPMPSDIQLTPDGRLKHFLTIEGLKPQLLHDIFQQTDKFLVKMDQPLVKSLPVLRGRTVANLFFENSTRTRTTFELAAKRLSADVLSLNISTSATSKGESLLDTLHNIQAMNVDMFVVRHQSSGAAQFIAHHVAPHISVLNAGDGQHAHPTQAMLDAYTIHRKKGDFGALRVAIVGDVMHSRVARSQIHALNTLSVGELRVIAPRTLLPADIERMGVHVYHDLKSGLRDVDVIIMLRLQKERMTSALLPSEQEYFQLYGLNAERLAYAKPDAIVMHPGPINRGVEIDSSVADGPQSMILQQVTYGLAIRMAIMSLCIGEQRKGDSA